jgi:hypothetical protein
MRVSLDHRLAKLRRVACNIYPDPHHKADNPAAYIALIEVWSFRWYASVLVHCIRGDAISTWLATDFSGVRNEEELLRLIRKDPNSRTFNSGPGFEGCYE